MMKNTIKTRPPGLSPDAEKWFTEFEKELRDHYAEYKEMAKPPECDETWYCLQYLELLIEEILGDAPAPDTAFIISERSGRGDCNGEA